MIARYNPDMTQIDRSALLPYPQADMYSLVADIECYPEFLEGCEGAEIIAAEDRSVTARLDLARAGIHHSFTTRNLMTPHAQIELTLVDGPFERFSGIWRFTALGENACKVTLSLDFQLRSGLVQAAIGKLFDKVALDLVDAVVRRATTLHGSDPR